MPFWKCYYHIVWATRYRQPVITPTFELTIFGAVERKCNQLRCELLGINGTTDHIHIALSIPPTHSVAHVVGQIKGVTSREVNQTFNMPDRFHWQESYSVLTFGEKVMPQVLNYIAHQKEHHAQNTVLHYLEPVDE